MSATARGSAAPFHLSPIVGECAAVRRAIALARRFAATPLPVLIVGPTGTGKELFAQHIHAWSGRGGALVDVNCGALPRDLIEGLLFGHRRGIFTGATETTCGLLEAADGGTLFLDELGNLSLEAQAKLLRALETNEVRRVGDTASRRLDLRVVCAVPTPLTAEIEGGAFRPELYQRVAGVVIALPPLCTRGDDVRLLGRHFAAAHGQRLAPSAEQLLGSYSWPGNVRELAAVVSRAAWLATGAVLDAEIVAEAIALGATPGDADAGGATGLADGDGRVRRDLLEVCETHGWHAASVAAALAVSRATLYRRLNELGISLRAGRRNSQLVLRQTENR